MSDSGLGATCCRKATSGISSTSVSSSARSVAARSRDSMRAISPKQSPGLPIAICLPLFETTRWPESTTNIAWPSSPSWHSASSGRSGTCRHAS